MSDDLRPGFDPTVLRHLEWMRNNGRVPQKLIIEVDLPEAPMGNEAGAHITRHIHFDVAAADPGLLGDTIRSLTRKEFNG